MREKFKSELPEFENWQEKNNKKIQIFIFIISLISLILAYYGYFYIYYNTRAFIDNVNKSVTNEIDNIYKKLNEKVTNMSINSEGLDVQNKGTVNVNYEGANIFNLDYNVINSTENLLISVEALASLGKERLLGGNILLQDDKIYFKSDDISTNLLSYNLKDAEKDLIPKMAISNCNIEDYNYLFKKLFSYHLEALKEAELSTIPKSLIEKEYKIVINAKNKKNVINKLNKLISNDTKLTNLLEQFEIEEYTYIDNMELIVRVNVFNNELKSFIYSNNDDYLEGTYDGSKYIIKDLNKNYLYVWSNDANLKMELYEDKELTMSFDLTYSNVINISLVYENNSISATLKNSNDKKYEIGFNFVNNDEDINLNIKFNVEKLNNIIKENGTGTIKMNNELINIIFTGENSTGKNLVKRTDNNSAKDINSLTETDLNEIYMNLYNIFDKLGLYNTNNDTSLTVF